MSTWLQQACDWWARSPGDHVPARHYEVLVEAGAIDSDEDSIDLTREGERIMRDHGYTSLGGGFWKRSETPK